MTHSKHSGSLVFLFNFMVDCNPLVLLFEYKPWGHAIPLSVSQSLVPTNSFSNCYKNNLMSLATCNPSRPPRHVVKGLRGLETSKLSNFITYSFFSHVWPVFYLHNATSQSLWGLRGRLLTCSDAFWCHLMTQLNILLAYMTSMHIIVTDNRTVDTDDVALCHTFSHGRRQKQMLTCQVTRECCVCFIHSHAYTVINTLSRWP